MSSGEPTQDRFEQAQQAWPGVHFSLPQWRAHLEAHPAQEADLQANGADLFLAAACASGEAGALGHLDAFLKGTAPAVRRYDPSPAFVSEVVQRVRIHLLVAEPGAVPRIARFDGRASLRSWLGVCAVRMALHLLRTRRNAREETIDWEDTLSALPTDQPELEAVRARLADTFNSAWREACAELPARQRTLLRMCFAEGAAIETIAATYAVHRVTVWRWLEDAKRRLLEGTRLRLGQRLAATDPSTASLLELVQSQLDLGLSQLSADGPRAAAGD